MTSSGTSYICLTGVGPRDQHRLILLGHQRIDLDGVSALGAKLGKVPRIVLDVEIKNANTVRVVIRRQRASSVHDLPAHFVHDWSRMVVEFREHHNYSHTK